MSRRAAAVFVLLVAIFALFHLAPHKQFAHGDDLDNHCGAWLISEGWVIHRDFFTHHPPFPYWFGAPAVRFFGNGPATFRWALIVFYALALAALHAANRRAARPFSFGLFVAFLALGHVHYWGHLYLSDGFYAFAILTVFVQFWRFDGEYPLRRSDWAIVALAVFAAFGSTLVAAYPLAVLAIGLAAKHFRCSRRLGVGQALGIAAIVAAPLVVAAVGMRSVGALRDYWEQGVVFNLRYYRADTGFAGWAPALAPLGFFLESAGRGIVHLVEALLLRHGALEFAMAAANVGVLAALAASRRFWTAAFYLTYVLTLLLRMGDFHEAPYIVHSLWAAAWLLRPVGERAAQAWRAFRSDAEPPAASVPDIARIAATALFLVMLARDYADAVTLARPPAPREKQIAEICARLTSSDERIAVFPNSPDIYMMSDRKPAVPCYYYLPWVDRYEPLRREIVERIERQEPKLVVINWWLFPTGPMSFRTYADEVRDAIRRNYRPVTMSIPRIYAPRSSFNEVVGRYERIRRSAVVEIAERDLLPLPVFAGSPVVQHFTLHETVTGAGLELLLSADRRSDASVELEFGVLRGDGSERLLVRERFRTAKVRYYPNEERRHRFGVSLKHAGKLEPGRYYFRLSSGAAAAKDALQVWSSPRSDVYGVGETTLAGEAIARTACFRLDGVRSRKPRGVYPVVEQALAGNVLVSAHSAYLLVKQSFTLREATTISAVSLLLGGPAGDAATTVPFHELTLRNAKGSELGRSSFRPPSAEREWIVVPIEPVFADRGEQLNLAIESTAPRGNAAIRYWTAGRDVYPGGGIYADISGRFHGYYGVRAPARPHLDDLCFRIYSEVPETDGRPDIIIGGLDFEPAAPAAVAPRGAIRVSLDLENRGTTETGPFWVEFFAAPLDFSGPMGLAVDSVHVENLAPGELRELKIDRALYPVADGRYSIASVADRPSEVRESDETNNRADAEGKALLVVARRAEANLFLDRFALGEYELKRGGPIDLRGMVSNSGPATAGPFTIEFWAARNPGDRAGRFPICDPIEIDSLAPNAILDLADFSRTLHDNLPTGLFHIGCTVDARDAVAETREHDNTLLTGPAAIEL